MPTPCAPWPGPSRSRLVELRAQGLVKRHPGVLALDDVSFLVRPGEVHALVGENGAGKSTLMRILSGATMPDAGTITIDGAVVVLDSPHTAHALGIRMIHQELVLVPGMTVAENICLGAEPSNGGVGRSRPSGGHRSPGAGCIGPVATRCGHAESPTCRSRQGR